MLNNLGHDETDIYDRNTATRVAVRIPPSAIAACIRVPPWKAVLTTLGILLAITDIPRTGSTYFVHDARQQVGPGIGMFWGPYDYHIAHLLFHHDASSSREQTLIDGSRDGKKLEFLDVWSYKHDTLTISTRAIAGYLNVASYPPCILYRERCKSAKLDIGPVFTMLDDLIQSIQTRLFADPALEARPFSFITWSNWVDRLHHRVYLAFGRNPDKRLHDLYHLSSRNKSTIRRPFTPLEICGHRRGPHGLQQHSSSDARPNFCDEPIKWRCANPTNPTSGALVPLWDQIAIRFDDLQRRYVDLDLDFTMFSTTLKEKSHTNQHIVPSISFVTDALEITTLIRGRRCGPHGGDCQTVFIDDYRYERAAIESDEQEWAMYVVILRWASQVYVWIRVSLLCAGCYFARAQELTNRIESLRSKLMKSGAILVRIPGHIIVYGSWTPLLGYSLAHFLDSSLVQTVGEYAWSSVGGFYSFHTVEYVMTASIQMRNIWMIALLWKLVSTVHAALCKHRWMCNNRGHDGVLAFRGGWIGLLSWLTTFGLMRALHFRDTNVVGFVSLPRHTSMSVTHGARNYSDYGFGFDAKCFVAVVTFVFSAGWLFQKLVWLITGRESSIFFGRSFYVPNSAGTLWTLALLDTFWLVRFRSDHKTARVYGDANSTFSRLITTAERQDSPSPPSITPVTSFPPLKTKACRVCGFESSMIHWRATQGCLLHEPILDVHRRTKALWSVVRLMNIANMTEPLAFFRLYVIGRPLYLYHVVSDDQMPYSILLPMRMKQEHERRDDATTSRKTAHNDGDALSRSSRDVVYELLQTVDSRDVPWDILVNCG